MWTIRIIIQQARQIYDSDSGQSPTRKQTNLLAQRLHKDITLRRTALRICQKKKNQWAAVHGFNSQRQRMHKIAINSYLLCLSYKACDLASLVSRHLLICLLVSSRF